MKYGSVCSGIEAASVAWHSLGWEAQWYSEIEHFPSEVLKHRFPNTPNLGDMTQLTSNPTFNEKSIDLLVGGTPCQSFSVAGLRGGLADPRGNLMLTFLALADTKKPKWIVWENVPGVLSSNGGRDFGTFLSALGNIGYGFAYRVLDAQHFGVAQRRRRVFVVGHLGDWRPAAAVLFESESLQRDSKQSRAKRQETPSDAEGSIRATGFAGNVESQVAACSQTTCDDYSRADGFNTVIEQVAQPQYFESHPNDSQVTGPHDVGNTVSARYGTGGGNTPIVSQPIAFQPGNLARKGGADPSTKTFPTLTKNSGDQSPHVAQPIMLDDQGGSVMRVIEDGVCGTLRRETHGHEPLVAQPIAVDCFNQTINEKTSQTIGSSASDVNHYEAVLEPKAVDFRNSKIDGDVTMTLQSKPNGGYSVNYQPGVLQTMAIRRLSPKECERLQGFPDDWTKIPYRNKPTDQCPDGPRYKACGNSMAVPVMRWIGQRIEYVESLMKDL
jgi:DNA (cytosine-5)-methyltransferase 1